MIIQLYRHDNINMTFNSLSACQFVYDMNKETKQNLINDAIYLL